MPGTPAHRPTSPDLPPGARSAPGLDPGWKMSFDFSALEKSSSAIRKSHPSTFTSRSACHVSQKPSKNPSGSGTPHAHSRNFVLWKWRKKCFDTFPAHF